MTPGPTRARDTQTGRSPRRPPAVVRRQTTPRQGSSRVKIWSPVAAYDRPRLQKYRRYRQPLRCSIHEADRVSSGRECGRTRGQGVFGTLLVQTKVSCQEGLPGKFTSTQGAFWS